jgi:hypothetical protein
MAKREDEFIAANKAGNISNFNMFQAKLEDENPEKVTSRPSSEAEERDAAHPRATTKPVKNPSKRHPTLKNRTRTHPWRRSRRKSPSKRNPALKNVIIVT